MLEVFDYESVVMNINCIISNFKMVKEITEVPVHRKDDFASDSKLISLIFHA